MRNVTARTKRIALPVMSLAITTGFALSACSASTAETQSTTSISATNNQVATTATNAETTAQTVSETAAAAEAFLGTLTEEQRKQVLYTYDDETKSTSWSNFPVTFVERAGVKLADLNDEQKAAALKVLEALLSEEGYETATGIMGGDEFLKENNSGDDALGGDQYYIAFFGEPSTTDAWAVQFGGHHLGINADLHKDAITFAPTHLGVQPASYTGSNGETVEPLAGMYDTAFAFYDSLTEEQKTKLYQSEQVASMVCAPGSTCDYPTGTGLKGSDLTDNQKQLLLDVIANWVGLADAETTAKELDKIEKTLDETYVNWSGATKYDVNTGKGIYFQISGPEVYIEFASQNDSAGADVDGYITAGWGHVHAIYRNPSNDYAGSVTQQASSGPMGGPMGGGPSGSAGPAGRDQEGNGAPMNGAPSGKQGENRPTPPAKQ